MFWQVICFHQCKFSVADVIHQISFTKHSTVLARRKKKEREEVSCKKINTHLLNQMFNQNLHQNHLLLFSFFFFLEKENRKKGKRQYFFLFHMAVLYLEQFNFFAYLFLFTWYLALFSISRKNWYYCVEIRQNFIVQRGVFLELWKTIGQ